MELNSSLGSCGDCVFYVETVELDGLVGLCRRFPPTVIEKISKPLETYKMEGAWPVFPIVWDHWGCGEFNEQVTPEEDY